MQNVLRPVLRDLNFFSPHRKALRESSFRLRSEAYRKSKQEKRLKKIAKITAPTFSSNDDSAVKFSNQEILRANPRVRRMVARPTAALPRQHYLLIKNGSVPLSLEDLSVPAPSIFDESKAIGLGEQYKERMVGSSGDSWLFKRGPKKGVKSVEWAKKSFDDVGSENALVVANGASESSPPIAHGSSGLRGVLDLHADEVKGKTEPSEMFREIINGSASEGDLTWTASSLISTLREKAIAFSATGLNPDLAKSIKSAMTRFPGVERKQRLEELAKCTWTFSQLVQEGRASTENCNLLIRAAKDRATAHAVHDSMLSLGVDVDEDTYVSLIMSCGRDASAARATYLKMRENLVRPTEKVFGALIQAHVRARDLPSAFSLLRKMEDSVGPPTSPVVYTMLLDGLVKANKLDVAWERFGSWRTWRGVKVDAVMFSVMIKACTRRAECERALGLLDDLRVSGEYPTDLTYTHLIECMSTRADFAEKAFELHRQMQLEGFGVNSAVASALMRAAANSGDLGRVRSTVSELARLGVPLTARMYALAVEGIANSIDFKSSADFEKNVRLKLAWHVIGDMRGKGLAVTAPVLNALMRVYAKADQPTHAVALLDQFAEFAVAPTIESYETLLQMFGDSGDVHRFFALYEHIAGMGEVSAKFHHLALDIAMESRSSKRTVAVLERMLTAGLRPLPAAAERLAVVGRKVLQIHSIVGKLVAQQRDSVHERTERENALLQLELEEYKTRLAVQSGKSIEKFQTVENEVKELYWEKQAGQRKRVKLGKSDHIQVKKKGGKMHGLRVDKPRFNLAAS